jgi:hypothetical protein
MSRKLVRWLVAGWVLWLVLGLMYLWSGAAPWAELILVPYEVVLGVITGGVLMARYTRR